MAISVAPWHTGSMERFLRASLLLYLLATALGLVLRYALVEPVELNFSNALHAHSHTLYFGWAALALFTLFYERVGATDAVSRGVLWTVIALSVATFGVFLHSGYARPGVIVSAASLFVWAAAVIVFWRRAKGQRSVDLTFLRIATIYVGIAGLSAAGRVVILMLKVANPLPGMLAVFGFLHCFAAFFTLGVMGLLIRWLEERGAPIDPRRLRVMLGFLTPLSALTFPLGVPGGMESPLGPPARIAAALLVIPNVLWLASLWPATAKLERSARLTLRTIWLAWALKTALEVLGAAGLAESAAAAHHPAILYLHVMLLGVVTASVLFLVRARAKLTAAWPVVLHQSGVALMTLGLAFAGLPAMFPISLPILTGLWLAAGGGAVVIAAGITTTVQVWRVSA